MASKKVALTACAHTTRPFRSTSARTSAGLERAGSAAIRRSIFAKATGADEWRQMRATFVRGVRLLGSADRTVGTHNDVVRDIGFPSH